jgi:hypothetical protein
MNTQQKLMGGDSEVTRLKGLWLTLSEEARDFWRSLFVSPTTQTEIRRQILAELQINLRFDNQLNRFREWLTEQDARDEEAQRMLEDQRRFTEQFGETLTKDQVREKVLKASYARTLASGDFKLGLATVREDRGLLRAQTDQKRFMRQTGELFTQWSADERAKEIANSNFSNADKIEKLGKAMFGEDW